MQDVVKCVKVKKHEWKDYVHRIKEGRMAKICKNSRAQRSWSPDDHPWDEHKVFHRQQITPRKIGTILVEGRRIIRSKVINKYLKLKVNYYNKNYGRAEKIILNSRGV